MNDHRDPTPQATTQTPQVVYAPPVRKSPRLGFWILVGLLAASGVAMAVIVLLGLTESKSFGLVGLVFLADVYLIVSLAARHSWLQRTIWVGTAATFLLGAIVTFWPHEEYLAEPYNDRVPYDEQLRSVYGLLSDVLLASHIVLCTLLALGLISVAYRWIKHDRILKTIYQFTFVSGFCAGVFWGLANVFRFGDDIAPLQLGISILALTAASIVIIGGIVQRNAQQALEREQATASAFAGAGSGASGQGRSDEELRALVRQYVDEYLEERSR